MKPIRAFHPATVLALASAGALLAACGGGGGGGGTPSSGLGTMRIALTDAPACGYDHVYVTVEKVRVHQSGSAAESEGGWRELVLATPRRIDLLTLANGVLEELGSMQLEAGKYSQVRLVLASNTGSGASALANAVHPTGGSETPLATPSAQQSGLKLQANVDVQAGQTADLLLDFDACRSVVRAGNSGNYNLKPVVAVVPRITTSIQGYVTNTLTLGATTVSAQQGGVAIRSTTPDATGRFNLPFLAAGTYDVVITSEGRATGVVTSVPLGTSSVVLSGTSTAIVLPVSSMANVTGTVAASTPSGTTTVSSPVPDAAVRATQALTGGPTVQVHPAVDASAGSYTLRLPNAAPVKAPFSTSALVFATDAPVAGKYSVEATAPGRASQAKPLDLGSAAAATVNFTWGP